MLTFFYYLRRLTLKEILFDNRRETHLCIMHLLIILTMISLPWARSNQISDDTLLKLYGPVHNTASPGDTGYGNANGLSSNIGTFLIDREILKKIFDIPSTPSYTVYPNNNPTARPMVTSAVRTSGGRSTSMQTKTTPTPCQCVPYNLCDSNYVGVNVNNPTMTGVGVIQIRLGHEGCEESLDVCCTIPASPTKPSVQKPKTNDPKGCGYRNPRGLDFTIVQGTGLESQFGEFPWVVALMDILDDSYVGSGVLIHPQVVLTVAHLVSDYSSGSLKIRAGEWDTQTIKEPYDFQERHVQQIYIHPEFNRMNLVNDIAVLHLETPVELAYHINTICLADQNEEFGYRNNCVANGWGKDHFGKDAEFAVILKKIEMDMVQHSRCNTLLKRTRLGANFNLHSSFVCAGGEEGKDTCTGDGGGPLACPIGNDRYKLAGLIAGGVGCGQKNVPGLYSSLPTLRSWVDEKMNILGYGTASYTI